jgi:hypothetical protein
MKDLIDELRGLLSLIDDEDFEFDVETGVETRSVGTGTGRRPRGPNHDRSKSSRHERSGREKFRARRRIKRLNRLLKRAERNGYDVEDLIGDEEPPVRVTVDEDTGEATIVVDSADAKLEWEAGEDTVTLKAGEAVQSETLPFTVGSVETETKPGLTTFHVEAR